jgi:hypothetical protein
MYVCVTISSSIGWKDTRLGGGKKTLRPVRGLALAVSEPRRYSLWSAEFLRIGLTPSGRLMSYGLDRRNGVNAGLGLGRDVAGDAVAELGDGRRVRSKVLLNVLSVVGVAADMFSTLLPVALAEEPYDVENWEVCNDSLGRLLGGM